MREMMKSMLRFSWAMSLFGARQAASMMTPGSGGAGRDAAAAFDGVSEAAERGMGGGLRSVYETGDRLQSGVVDLMFGVIGGGARTGRVGCCGEARDAGQRSQSTDGATSSPAGWRARGVDSAERAGAGPADSARSLSVPLIGTTQGPFWPPSEIVDQDGNFIVIGGFILTEVSPGKVVPVPNEGGVIVSKDTTPPLRDGREDFSNPFGAPYQIVRQLDLGPDGRDWELRPYSLSAGPFEGDFGGGRPRVPAAGQSQYNLNANPLWNKTFLPAGHETPHYYRPSYPLNEVPILRLDEIPGHISIGVRVNGEGRRGPAGGQVAQADFRRRQPITLREYLGGRGQLWVTPIPSGGVSSVYTGARFDFGFEGLLPHSVYGVWALHAATLSPPTNPNFILPVPLAVPNLLITGGRGEASASFELQNPFPDPASDAGGNRLVAVAVIYHSDFQSWGAALSGIATGVNAHTAMSANFSNLSQLMTTGRQS